MNTLFPFTLASVLLVSACGSSPQNKSSEQAPVEATPTSSAHSYRCESGETITTIYHSSDSAAVRYKGSNYSMKIAVSASGARYVGGDLEWWVKGSGAGSEGTLFHHQGDGSSGKRIESCVEI
jgi:membrane-bound inhibitor of C-type lysozyme